MSLTRSSVTGLRHNITLQSSRYNRADESVEVFAIVSIHSKRIAAWRMKNAAVVGGATGLAAEPLDTVCTNGLGYTFGTWSDGVFDLLRPGDPAARSEAIVRHAVPWFDSADEPTTFVHSSPTAVRSINAHSLLEWLLSLERMSRVS